MPLRATLWFVPVLMIALSVLLAAVVALVDGQIPSPDYPSWLNRGTDDDVRTLLSVVATSLISVLALVLSITLVALQLASANLGPSLLRAFVRDPLTQVTVGLFTGTFVFALITMGGADGSRLTGVPYLGATLTLGLAISCIVLLVFFIHNITVSVQPQNVLAHVNAELRRAIADLDERARRAQRSHDPDRIWSSVVPTERRIDAEGADVLSRRSGYVQWIRFDDLIDEASDANAVVRVRHRPGQFVLSGTPLATVWPASQVDRLAIAVEDNVPLGSHRTLHQDLGFAIDQLVEIALRALSPAMNTAFIALACIDWLGEGLRALATVPVAWRAHADDKGRLRLLEEPLVYEDVVSAAFAKIRAWGVGDPAIAERLIGILGDLGQVVGTPAHRRALVREGERVLAAAHGPSWIEADREELYRQWTLAREGLDAADDGLDDGVLA